MMALALNIHAALAAIVTPARGARAAMPADSISDADLVARAQGGDRWAEEALYRRHVRYVAGVVTRLVGRRAEAEDIVQDTFATALGSLAGLRDGAAVRAWLAQIAVRQAHRRFRRRRLMRALGLDRSVDDAALEALASDDAPPDVRAELAALDRVLAALPTDQRVAWMLRRVEGWVLEEVAEACDCSLATAKRRIAAAEEQVRKFVNIEEEAS